MKVLILRPPSRYYPASKAPRVGVATGALWVAAALRQASHDGGGPHATVAAQDVLGDGLADAAVRGEGEAAAAEFLDRCPRGDPVDGPRDVLRRAVTPNTWNRLAQVSRRTLGGVRRAHASRTPATAEADTC